MAINIESGAGAQPIGFIGALTGSAIARGADGVERALQIGDPVYTNEVIITGELSTVVVDFVDGTRLDLGRESQAVLDSDVFDPATLADVTDVAATAEAMQQAILAGKDPSEIFEAPAAGEEAVTDEGGTEAVTIDLTGQQVTPESGFETTGLAFQFPEPREEIPGVEEEVPLPVISINDVTVNEPVEGTTIATFTVTLNTPSTETVTVNYATADIPGGAVAGQDYTATSGTVTFLPGETSQTIDVEVLGDNINEPSELFNVVLSGPVNATTSDTGIGTILDSSPAPEITIDDITIYEGGEGGPATASFTITMSNPTYEDVTVNWSVSPDTAALSDYSGPTSGTATIAAGTTTVVVSPGLTFTAVDDSIYENPETFNVSLDSISGGDATIGDSTGVGTIISEDPAPEITIDDITIYEGGEGGPATASFTITMSNPTYEDVTVNWSV
ncbi:MAG: retention module-containing protein, partial [Granulosicoccaceae bacterium]